MASLLDSDSLKCNMAHCRKSVSLDGKAVVTNCSHVFCVDCANAQTCLTHGNPHPVCPACETQLTEPEDVICTSLNPSADYKSSVLSGLPPSTVLEIASRALNFWAYQQSMEASYQQMIIKQSHERAAMAERDRNNIENQAANEIKLLQDRLRGTELELSHERSKLHEAAETHKTNQKSYEKLKSHYDRLRSRTLLAPGGVAPSFAPPTPSLLDPMIKSTPVRGAPAARPVMVSRTFGAPQSAPNGLGTGATASTPACSSVSGNVFSNAHAFVQNQQGQARTLFAFDSGTGEGSSTHSSGMHDHSLQRRPIHSDVQGQAVPNPHPRLPTYMQDLGATPGPFEHRVATDACARAPAGLARAPSECPTKAQQFRAKPQSRVQAQNAASAHSTPRLAAASSRATLGRTNAKGFRPNC